ncbi:MAG: 4-coumarate--CoA ligase [Sphingopyxis macrogoltabida]|uniref:4-coumarate--CoA ligase n=1 Tax=Sphingopyxis macrogoltabida TaxID=33050 RepID=A0A2W5LCW6_SPHMC|nr:MAG: 4-coumarate--CoA ligase [Sphingopyxis macrogoltabida]
MTRHSRSLDSAFDTLTNLLRLCAADRPDHPAIIDGERVIDYRRLDGDVDRAAAALSAAGVCHGDRVAIVADMSAEYLVATLAALRLGAISVPIAPSATSEAKLAMLSDAAPSVLFADQNNAASVAAFGGFINLEESKFDQWLPPLGTRPEPVDVDPDHAFNIIYSSGTTGTPKGIVQSHAMRWHHVQRGRVAGYSADSITLVSTPLYSNTTLVSVIPTLAFGGTLVLLPKFDAKMFLELAERWRVTHAMLVPVQYRRLLGLPEFNNYDLSSFQMKTCTSAPFAADLKAEVLRRWPGGLVEIYGMTEGGASMTLAAHLYPDKLHTVGRPVEGHFVRIVDDAGDEVLGGGVGEIVGRSPAMMSCYHNQPLLTREAEWYDDKGIRYIRTGDIGKFDEDGFLILLDRKKDMIISGGFNIFPSDLEAILRQHPGLSDVAVVGVPSAEWGETPVVFAVPQPGANPDRETVRDWFAERVGKTQRLSDLVWVTELPRNAIGKVLKRDLRDKYIVGQPS